MSEKQTFPEIVLFPALERVKQVVHFVFDQMHYERPNTGAAEMLDAQLYDQPRIAE